MKIFSIHIVRNMFAVVVALGLGYIAYTVNPTSGEIPKVEAGSAENISGWIWANTPQSDPVTGADQGIGWISMNSTTDGSAYSYGVNVGTSQRGLSGSGIDTFSGYAYGENIDWISFNSADTASCVTAFGGVPAQIDWSTGVVSGWAKALNGTQSGWDGCISLSSSVAPVYGVKVDHYNKFSGYAWGSDVLGWIDFTGAKLADRSCLKELVPADGWTLCAAPRACTAAENAAGATLNLIGTRRGQCVPPNGNGEVTDFCNVVLVCSPTSSTPTPGKRNFWQF